MRIRVRHTTSYAYDRPARVLQHLRLTPRNHDGQHVLNWRVDCDADVRLTPADDVFGNIVHTLETEGRVEAIRLEVTGEVETTDTAGVIRGAPETVPLELWLRETPLTRPDPELAAFARDVAVGNSPLERLHGLLAGVFRDIAFDTVATHSGSSAQEAFALRRGVCQDMSHVFITAARSLDIPARYVSGHLARQDMAVQEASHAWAEAYVAGFGWVGFDPANGISPTEAYVRVAVGLDYLGAAPVRGAVYGGGGERMKVRLSVEDLANPSHAGQSQA